MKFCNSTALSIALLGAISLTACGEEKSDDTIIFHSTEQYRALDFPFSVATEVDGWIYLSGTLGLDPETRKIVEGGIEPESRQTMENIKASLESIGSSLDRVVKCTVMIDDMADWPAFNVVYKSYFDGNYPARSAFGAQALALNAKVEVECIARR